MIKGKMKQKTINVREFVYNRLKEGKVNGYDLTNEYFEIFERKNSVDVSVREKNAIMNMISRYLNELLNQGIIEFEEMIGEKQTSPIPRKQWWFKDEQ